MQKMKFMHDMEGDFSPKELQNYFNSKSWYRGTIEPSDFQQSVLNDYEKKNADY